MVVAYDITDDGRRAHVANVLEGFGERVQGSVFECDISEAERERMRRRLLRLIDASEDSVRVYPLGEKNRQAIEIMGIGEPLVEEDIIVI